MENSQIQSSGKKKIMKTSKKIIGISSSILIILDLLGAINGIYTRANTINYTQAHDLMKNYGKSYEYALKYKAKYMDSEDEDDKKKIKEEALRNFERILSPDALKIVGDSIFSDTDERTGYTDVKEYDYNEFKYTKNISLDSNEKEIIVQDSYITKVNKINNQEITIPIDTQVFTYSRRPFWGDFIIENCTSYRD